MGKDEIIFEIVLIQGLWPSSVKLYTANTVGPAGHTGSVAQAVIGNPIKE